MSEDTKELIKQLERIGDELAESNRIRRAQVSKPLSSIFRKPEKTSPTPVKKVAKKAAKKK